MSQIAARQTTGENFSRLDVVYSLAVNRAMHCPTDKMLPAGAFTQTIEGYSSWRRPSTDYASNVAFLRDELASKKNSPRATATPSRTSPRTAVTQKDLAAAQVEINANPLDMNLLVTAGYEALGALGIPLDRFNPAGRKALATCGYLTRVLRRAVTSAQVARFLISGKEAFFSAEDVVPQTNGIYTLIPTLEGNNWTTIGWTGGKAGSGQSIEYMGNAERLLRLANSPTAAAARGAGGSPMATPVAPRVSPIAFHLPKAETADDAQEEIAQERAAPVATPVVAAAAPTRHLSFTDFQTPAPRRRHSLSDNSFTDSLSLGRTRTLSDIGDAKGLEPLQLPAAQLPPVAPLVASPMASLRSTPTTASQDEDDDGDELELPALTDSNAEDAATPSPEASHTVPLAPLPSTAPQGQGPQAAPAPQGPQATQTGQTAQMPQAPQAAPANQQTGPTNQPTGSANSGSSSAGQAPDPDAPNLNFGKGQPAAQPTPTPRRWRNGFSATGLVAGATGTVWSLVLFLNKTTSTYARQYWKSLFSKERRAELEQASEIHRELVQSYGRQTVASLGTTAAGLGFLIVGFMHRS